METSGHRTGGEREVPQPSRLKAASARGKECRLGGEGPENERRRGRGREERVQSRGVDKWREADGRGPEGEREGNGHRDGEEQARGHQPGEDYEWGARTTGQLWEREEHERDLEDARRF